MKRFTQEKLYSRDCVNHTFSFMFKKISDLIVWSIPDCDKIFLNKGSIFLLLSSKIDGYATLKIIHQSKYLEISVSLDEFGKMLNL